MHYRLGMTLTALVKSKEQQLTNGQIQNKSSFRIETNFHFSILIIKVCEIYSLHTFKIDIHSYSGRIEQNTEIGETIQRVYKPTKFIVI